MSAAESPSALDAEAGLLGSILTDSDPSKPTLTVTIAEGGTSASFYDHRNGIIYGRMLAMQRDGITVESYTLAKELQRAGQMDEAGGLPHITEIERAAPTTAMFKRHLRDVLTAARRRMVCDAMQSAVEALRDPSAEPEEILGRVRKVIAAPVSNTAQVMDWDALLSFDGKADPDCMMGRRYLGRTDGCVIVAPSGVGKSVLALQLAACAALGRNFFGMQIHAPLRVIYIQAEDSLGDVAEAVQGFVGGFNPSAADLDALRQRLRIVRWNDCAGEKFLAKFRAEYTQYPFDLAIINPLFSFAGCNLSEQKEVSPFLRNGLNPILNETRAAAVIVHHTNKPPQNPDKPSASTEDELRYIGSGSAELTNWARSYITLQGVKSAGRGVYKLTFAKRGNRTGIVGEDGKPVLSINVEHSPTGLCWLPSDWKQSQSASICVQKFSMDRARSVYNPDLSWPQNKRAIAADQGLSERTVEHYKKDLETVI